MCFIFVRVQIDSQKNPDRYINSRFYATPSTATQQFSRKMGSWFDSISGDVASSTMFDWTAVLSLVHLTGKTWTTYVATFLAIATTIVLAYWISASVPGMDMAIALLLLMTPQINWMFLTAVIIQLLYRGRDVNPTQRSKKTGKYL